MIVRLFEKGWWEREDWTGELTSRELWFFT